MIRDYIINAGMLIAFTSIIYQLFRNIGFSLSSSKKIKLLTGVIFGLLSIVLMEFSIRLPNNVLIDFRSLAIIMAATSTGPISAMVAGIVTILARLLLFAHMTNTVAVVLNILLATIVVCIVTQLNIKKLHHWFYSVIGTVLVNCSTYAYLIDDPVLELNIILSYGIGFALIATLMYTYSHYLELINESYRHCKVESKKDFLTGLNNVRSFDELYNHILQIALTKQQILSLMYIDIDFFKRVNDTYGHKDGDIVLARLGELLKNTSRSMDIVSRNGGEEFSIILIDCDPNLAMEIGERIRKTVENTPIELSNGQTIHITISIGIASYPFPINQSKMLREKADEALYEAKRTGRNKTILARVH